MKAKKVAATIAACGLVAALAVGGTLAYLTDNESHTNTVRVSGNIKIDLVEENWNQTDENNDGVPDDAENMVPNQEVAKDPKVINTGDNDAFAFIRLTVPVRDVTKVMDNGTLNTREDSADKTGNTPLADGQAVFHEPQDIFYFKQASDALKDHVNKWGTGWLRLGAEEYNVEKVALADGSNGGYSTTDQTVGEAVYVFGFNKKLAGARDGADEGESTTTLFDKVQVKNIIENELASDQIQNIKVEAFAIQADKVIDANGVEYVLSGEAANAAADATKLKEIYDIFVAQNGTVAANGDFVYNKYQDEEHGQVEKEADINNKRDLANDKQNTTKYSYNGTMYDTMDAAQSAATQAGDNNPNIVTVPANGPLQTSYTLAIDKSILTVDPTAQTQTDIGTLSTTINTRKANATGDVTYVSSNPEVATVDAQGKVTPVTIGDTTITATLDGVKTSVHVSVVKDNRPVNGNVAANDAQKEVNGTTTPVTPQP